MGRPNVGKSTLLNQLLGQKISVTSHKAQTTRHHILGIATHGDDQVVYVDTPGMFTGGRTALDKHMVREAQRGLTGVDAIVFVIEAMRWTDADEFVLEQLRQTGVPIVLLINKIDRVVDRPQLLPFIDQVRHRMEFNAIVPMAARRGENLESLQKVISELLKPGPHAYSDEQVTDRSVRFLVAEIIREKLLRLLHQEVPHKLNVAVDEFDDQSDLVRLLVTIWVERESHRGIVIGKQGQILKQVGEQARRDIEVMLSKKVFLQTWVKVREGWSDDERALQQFGFDV